MNRDTRGFIKLVANADTGEILGLTAVAKDARELAAAGVHILSKIVAEVANGWSPYLTTAEGIRITAKALTTESQNCPAAPDAQATHPRPRDGPGYPEHVQPRRPLMT